jgi:formamidopyrimidine-DNA glycosylase
MPELPEVEYTARQLRATILGATISEALVFWERTIGHPALPDFLTEIAGRHIEGIRRRGKFLLFDLSGSLLLTVHRRMTGNLLLLPPGWAIDTSLQQTDPLAWSIRGPSFKKIDPASARTPVDNQSNEVSYSHDNCQILTSDDPRLAYCRVCFHLADGRYLLFTDPRKFGRIELWPRELEQKALAGLGPEPLGDEFTVGRLAEALAVRKSTIKQVLLDQKVVAGLGNIYADEALFYAAIHPLRRANSLSPTEVQLLHEGIVHVLTMGIQHGGTSFNDYRDLWGEAGENYNHVRVYHREGQPCVRCGMPIERIIVAQRSTHFCPACQKLTSE